MTFEYQIELTPAVQRQFKKLPKPAQKAILKQIDLLKIDPKPIGYKKLVGLENLYRVKINSYRIIYTIEHNICLIIIVKVGDRKEVYRNLKS